MKSSIRRSVHFLVAGTLLVQLGLTMAAASPVITDIAMAPRLTIQSDTNTLNLIQFTTNVAQSNWVTLTNLSVCQTPYWFTDQSAPGTPARYYRVLETSAPAGMALVPAGSFAMGDAFHEGATNELPVHLVFVSGFFMDTNLVSYALWQGVYAWAINHGYSFDNAGSTYSGYSYSVGTNYPVQLVDWYDAVKWCNLSPSSANINVGFRCVCGY